VERLSGSISTGPSTRDAESEIQSCAVSDANLEKNEIGIGAGRKISCQSGQRRSLNLKTVNDLSVARRKKPLDAERLPVTNGDHSNFAKP
jgi:hypothetical protein